MVGYIHIYDYLYKYNYIYNIHNIYIYNLLNVNLSHGRCFGFHDIKLYEMLDLCSTSSMIKT